MDINGGQNPNPNGSPVFPGTVFTGPLIAGNIGHSDGSGTLASLGSTGAGLANQGYCMMAQTAVITQAASAGQSAGVFVTPIVIPAQSQIERITLNVTTAFSGTATTLGVGSTASQTALTAAAAVVTSGVLGTIPIQSGTGATQVANWDNVGNTDIQITTVSTNTGTGVGTLTVSYLQGINNAS
jgi:hypothetical protein